MQQQSLSSRKRQTPGPSSLVQQPVPSQQTTFQYAQMPDNPDFANFDFTTLPSDHAYADPSLADADGHSSALNALQAQTYGGRIAPAPSTDLVRRARNQELAPQNGGQEQWNGAFGDMEGQEDEDERDLDLKVQAAKKDAQGKRKQIPPFVQKLSSFLDNNHTDLIRWSDDGRSFIVLDEDEFARTLIPELFKHNNYASFVRQLNMYGFHKTVNITDGSLRQSEKARKGVKPPSMYSHPYFRKNRPDLLWLIQKPTGKSSSKRKREGTKEGVDSDEERQYSPGPESKLPGELGPAGPQDVTPIPRRELSAVRQEIKKLQQQQSLISRMIGQLKEQNDQFYRQATAFQALHDRHENSINAILTFLATFYNRSLEGHAGQNLVNMFNNTGNQNNQQQQQGSVVEEYNDGAAEADNQVQRYVKRPQLLLTGPNASPQIQQGGAVTQPNSARASTSPPVGGSVNVKRDSSTSVPPHSANALRSAASPAVKEDAQTPDLLNTVPEKDQMLSLINDINATTAPSDASTPAYEYSDALNNIQKATVNAPGPLNSQQANDMISMINQQTGNNALTRQNDNLNMDALSRNHQNIERLSRLSHDNSARITDLQTRLGPLSPTGSIPGLADSNFDTTGDPGQFDPISLGLTDYDAYNKFDGNGSGYDVSGDLDDDADLAFFGNNENFSNDTNFDNLDWNYDPAAAGDSGADMFQAGDGNTVDDHLAPHSGDATGAVESLSSEATSPAHLGEDGEAAGLEPGTPNKRQRTS